tara:strand:- start:214 stop:378 length:165 start_codon:yes stop_codon:yes gene_type:complete
MTNQSGISGIEFMMPPDINKYEHEMGKCSLNLTKNTYFIGKIEQLIPRGTPGAS